MKYYLDHYDAIIIGGALAGLSCAIDLAKENKKVLVLERHNLPGGIATSFVRKGVEIDATLHELYDIGTIENPGKIRKYFEDIGLPINWREIPEPYRFKDKNADISLECGYEQSAKKIDDLYPGSYQKVLEFYNLCHEINIACKKMQNKEYSKLSFKEIKTFLKTIGYTMDDVLNTFKFSKEIKEILSIYWIYLGTPPHIIPFTIMAIVIDEYIDKPPAIPENKSYEMGLKLSEYATSLGVQVEYSKEVKNIVVEKKVVKGVILKDGTQISSDYVISGAYPQTVYSKMIYPQKETPKLALKFINSREVNVSGYSVFLLLEGKPSDYNIKTYTTFLTDGEMDSKNMYENMNSLGDYKYMALTCYNMADKNVTKEGTILVNLTVMPRIDAWNSITKETYFKTKRRIARELINVAQEALSTEFFSHIIDIYYETPITYAHYAKAYNGAVYGFNHTVDDHFIIRYLFSDKDIFIKHLYFAGAHGFSGDGEATQFSNGQKAASDVLARMKKEGTK